MSFFLVGTRTAIDAIATKTPLITAPDSTHYVLAPDINTFTLALKELDDSFDTAVDGKIETALEPFEAADTTLAAGIAALGSSLSAKYPSAGGSLTGQLRAIDGIDTAPGLSYANESNSGLRRVSTHLFAFCVNDFQRVTIDQNDLKFLINVVARDVFVMDTGGFGGDNISHLGVRSGASQGAAPLFYVQSYVGFDLITVTDISPTIVDPQSQTAIGAGIGIDSRYGYLLGSDRSIGWASSTSFNPPSDTDLHRRAAGVVAAGNGAGGNGSLYALTMQLPGSTSGLVTLRAPATTASYTFTFPADDGTPGQVMSTDGSGTTTWIDQTGGGGGGGPATEVDGEDATGTDEVAAPVYIRAGLSTGDAEPGKIILQMGVHSVTSGTDPDTAIDALTIQRDTETGWSDDQFRVLPYDTVKVSLGRADRGFAFVYCYQLIPTYISPPASSVYLDDSNGVVGIGGGTRIGFSASGGNSGSYDTGIQREGAGILRIITGPYSDALTDVRLRALRYNELWSEGAAAATALGAVVGKHEIFDNTGASLGFMPIYDAIT